MAFALILFFLCINIGSYVVSELDLLPVETSAYADPSTISSTYLTVPLSLAVIGISVVVSILARNPYITIAGLIVFAVDRLLPLGGWAITGFPTFLAILGVPLVFTVGLQLLFYFVWFMAIMELLSGRMNLG